MDEMPDPSEPEGEAPAGVRPRDALLDYPRLRMAGPGDAQRGRLVPASERRLLLELLVEQRVEIRLDVLELVRGSGREADEIASRPLPAGYRPPDPQDGFDYAYAADHPIDVPSDGAAHSVPLAERAGEARPRFVAVPRETQEVFRTVELVNPLDAPLLPGPADVYAGGDYLMTTDIRLTPARGRLTLGLGVEQALKVARNVRFEEQAAGLMRGALDLRHEIRIDLKSHLPHAATVEVRDRVPVARENDDDVRVSIDEVEPRWEPFEQDEQPLEGGHRWVVEVPPRGERALRAVYVVRIPSKLELAGGNRRDG
jgi:hypothetical protein